MEILIRPVLRQAQQLRLSLHLRFLHAPHAPADTEDPGAGPARARARIPSGMSYVIIHRPYEYLEPTVRELFRQAADVEIIVDRRWRDRRTEPPVACEGPERRVRGDRRASLPMLDVLISVAS